MSISCRGGEERTNCFRDAKVNRLGIPDLTARKICQIISAPPLGFAPCSP